ncbi:PilX N-terminal domain-containing pilus assembly protein [Pseudomonas chengduensis]|jgi:type IV pilus assembly protein PilX|nr:PilX N-terminal domain-containing pilus assembly protein [Pseudomonas chengduensis]MAE22936.1 pilus assembly protein PilX [Pseudomonas sp.]MDH1283533.1 PilX N-terminal domain-containing pilus assembly protein [Pseudomonas chengduensis]MDH1537957.1 PilX N-terminal domain-containing pilus assembly protein [Pseudomonas chengduensis]
MKTLSRNRQTGATLLLALILLAVVTVLTVSNMREVTLEGRMTANRMQAQQLQITSESALREAEKRFYGPAYTEEKLTEKAENCQKSNVYNALANKPCLIKLTDTATIDRAAHLSFQLNPLEFIKNSTYLSNWTGVKTESAGNTAFTPWMPYRGTDPASASALEHKAYWNSVRIPAEGVNAEYGDALQGKGTYFYLITAQAADQFAVQSTMANIYVGINN